MCILQCRGLRLSNPPLELRRVEVRIVRGCREVPEGHLRGSEDVIGSHRARPCVARPARRARVRRGAAALGIDGRLTPYKYLQIVFQTVKRYIYSCIYLLHTVKKPYQCLHGRLTPLQTLKQKLLYTLAHLWPWAEGVAPGSVQLTQANPSRSKRRIYGGRCLRSVEFLTNLIASVPLSARREAVETTRGVLPPSKHSRGNARALSRPRPRLAQCDPKCHRGSI